MTRPTARSGEFASPRRAGSIGRVGHVRRPRAAFVPMLVIGALSGCGSDDDRTPIVDPDPPTGSVDYAPGAQTPATADPDALARLEGTWDLCTGNGLRNTYVFQGNDFEQYVAYFLGDGSEDCSGEPDQSDGLQSPFTPLDTGTFELGDTVTTDTGVKAFEIDFAVGNVQGFDTVEPLRTYSLVSFNSPTEIVFPFLRGATPQERPTDLEFDSVYIKRP